MSRSVLAIVGMAVVLCCEAFPATAQVDVDNFVLGTQVLRQSAPQPLRVAQRISRADIREAQRLLNSNGYAAGPVDGAPGRKTSIAISAFQRNHGMPVTGQIDASLLSALRALAADDRQAADAPAQFLFLRNVDLPSGDYRSGMSDPQLSNISEADCAAICAQDVRCEAFTYNAKAAVCILKDHVPNRVPFAGAVSGIKQAISGTEATAAASGDSVSGSEQAANLPGVAVRNRRFVLLASGVGSIGREDEFSDERLASLRDAVLRLAFKRFPDLWNDPEFAFGALRLIGKPAQARILRQAGLDTRILNSLRRYRYGVDLQSQLDEFDRRALLQTIRKEAPSIISESAPALPLSVFIVCPVQLTEYNFQRQAFNIIRDGTRTCGTIRFQAGGYGEAEDGYSNKIIVTAPIPTDRLRFSIPIAETEARTFRNEFLGGAEEGPMQAGIIMGIEARITKIVDTGTTTSGKYRNFTLKIEPESAALYRADDLSTPIRDLGIEPIPSLANVSAVPSGLVSINDWKSLNLLRLARGEVTPDESAWRYWAIARADDEARGRFGGWARFFDEDNVSEIARGTREPEPELVANFSDWTRQRARALPESLSLLTDSAGISFIVSAGRPGVVMPFMPRNASDESALRRTAQQAGVIEDRAVSVESEWSNKGIPLFGVGLTNVVMVLPQPQSNYVIELDPSRDYSNQRLDVLVDISIAGMTIERHEDAPPILIIHIVPLSARILDEGGGTVASATFEATSDAASATAGSIAGTWAGRYRCKQGWSGMELQIEQRGSGRLAAELSFFALPENPDVPSGRFEMFGQFDPNTRLFVLSPGKWIERPAGFSASRMQGQLGAAAHPDEGHAKMTVDSQDSGCDRFELARGDRAALLASLEESANLERQGLREADILGIRMGTPVEEADQIIRDHMNVGWVATAAVPEDEKERLQKQTEPYREYTVYLRSDGQEAIALFRHSDVSDEVASVTRIVALSPGTSSEGVVGSLMEKYGAKPVEHVKEIHSHSLTWAEGDGYDSEDCNVELRSSISSRDMKVIEGPVDHYGYPDISQQLSAPAVDVWGAKDRSGSIEAWDSGRWRSCGPQIEAFVQDDRLQVAIFDLAAYANSYAQHVAKAIPKKAGPDL